MAADDGDDRVQRRGGLARPAGRRHARRHPGAVRGRGRGGPARHRPHGGHEPTLHEYGQDPVLARTGQHRQHPSTPAPGDRNEQDGSIGTEGGPFTAEHVTDSVTAPQESGHGDAEPADDDPEPSTDKVGDAASKQTPSESHSPQTSCPPEIGDATARATQEKEDPPTEPTIDRQTDTQEPASGRALTTVDRYYLAWTHYLEQHSNEPTAGQLSAYLTDQGINSRDGKPVSPSTLRRYYVPFRIYRTWAEHRARNDVPSPDAVAQDCSTHGITAQYNKPITPDAITKQSSDFERRWHALARDHTGFRH